MMNKIKKHTPQESIPLKHEKSSNSSSNSNSNSSKSITSNGKKLIKKNLSSLKKNLQKTHQEKLILIVKILNCDDIGFKNSNCNPICCVIYNNQVSTTHVIKNTNNPKWNKKFKFTLPNSPKNDTIRFIIFDALDKKSWNNNVEQCNGSTGSHVNTNNSSVSYSSFHQDDMLKVMSNNSGSGSGSGSGSSTSSTSSTNNNNNNNNNNNSSNFAHNNSTVSVDSTGSNSSNTTDQRYLEYNIDDSTDSFIDDQIFSNHQLLQSMYSNKKFIYMGELNLEIRSIFDSKYNTLIRSTSNNTKKDKHYKDKLISNAKYYNLQSKSIDDIGSKIALSFELYGQNLKNNNNNNKNNNIQLKDSSLLGKYESWCNSVTDFISSNNFYNKINNNSSTFENDIVIDDELQELESINDLQSFVDDQSLYSTSSTSQSLINSLQEEYFDVNSITSSIIPNDIATTTNTTTNTTTTIPDKTINNNNTEIDELCTIIEDLELDNDNSQVLAEFDDDEFDEEEFDEFDEEEYSEEDENEKNSHLFSKKKTTKLRRKKKPQWVISKKNHASGVVILDIIGISKLPTLKNLIRYTMDPFVILTFGRRVFKTSWKRHNLNPTFNERVIFDIYEYEKNFDFDFKVIDRDSISSHDKIAKKFVSFNDMLQYQHKNNTNETTNTFFEIPLDFDLNILKNQNHMESPLLKLNFQFLKYEKLNSILWNKIIQDAQLFDILELSAFLEKVGDFQPHQIIAIFEYYKKAPWSREMITKDELIEYLTKNFMNFKIFKRCPFCNSTPERTTRNSLNSKLIVENDLVTHMSVCNTPTNMKLLKANYVSPSSASKKWVSRFFVKLINGKYALGSNNANILVQDRDTGIIMDEKISAHVKLGIRVLYKKRRTPELKNFKILLKNLTIKEGLKFDNPLSIKYIDSFIKFHELDLSECLPSTYKNFNEFFYRKLKPDARKPESDDPRILLSPADCRCTVFQTVSKSKEMWIKGEGFTLSKLTKGLYDMDREFTIAIFRLAPQDYHRFHSPCDGVVGKPIFIEGEYYTVNPMAIRTKLDVFGENVRCVIPIQTEKFGEILYIPVGAMMVGSIILTRKEGDFVKRGEELGYFKFGGSSILLVIHKNKILFDDDLLKNSDDCIETLVKVGMSIGHTPDIPQFKRNKKTVNSTELEKIKRTITLDKDTTWEFITANEQLEDERLNNGVEVFSQNEIQALDSQERGIAEKRTNREHTKNQDDNKTKKNGEYDTNSVNSDDMNILFI